MSIKNIVTGQVSSITSFSPDGEVTGLSSSDLAVGTVVAGDIEANNIISLTSLTTNADLSVLGNADVAGNITSTYFFGNISAASGFPQMYSNIDVASYLPTYTGNLTALVGDVTTVGNITGGNILGNGSQLTGMYSDSNVAAYLSTSTGNVAGNVATFTGNVTGDYFLGNGSQLTGLPVQYTDSNVTALLSGGSVTTEIITTSNLYADGTVTGGYIIGDGGQLANITAGNITGQVANALVSGTVYTAAQPNITSAGDTFSAGNVTVTSLQVNTDATITGNLTVTGNANIVGNITQISGNSGQFFGDASGFGALYAGTIGGVANIANSPLEISTNANTYSQVNIQNVNNGTRASSDYVATADNGTDTTYYADFGIASSTQSYPDQSVIGPNDVYVLSVGDGISTGVSNIANLVLASTNGAVKTVVGGANTEHTSTVTNHANTVAVGADSGTFVVNGDMGIGGNVVMTGNIAASYFLGNGSQLTGLPASYTDSNVTTLLSTGISSNIVTTGNVTGAYFVGNGSLLTGIATSSYGNANVAAYLPTYTGNIGNVGNAVGNLVVANILNSAGNPFITKPTYEAWVDPAVGLDTNPGTLSQPWKTIAHAQSVISNSRYTLNLLTGNYAENITWTNTNCTINGPGPGNQANITGAWTFALATPGTSVRIVGVKFTDITIAGVGGTYFTQCSLDGNISVTGDGALEFDTCALEDSGTFFITAGANAKQYTTILNSTFSDMTINNANAVVTYQNSQSTNSLITLPAGVALIYNCSIVSTTSGDMVLNSSVGTTVIINGTTFADVDGSSAAVTIGGFWSFVGVNYDVVNSVISGTNFGEPTYTDRIVSFGDIVAGTTITATGSIINSRVTPRSVAVTSGTTITPTGNTSDQYNVTALAAGATVAAPSGTPTNGQKLTLRIKDNGSAQTLAWNAIYRAVGTTLPTTTVASKTLYMGFIYNSTDTKWDCVALSQEA